MMFDVVDPNEARREPSNTPHPEAENDAEAAEVGSTPRPDPTGPAEDAEPVEAELVENAPRQPTEPAYPLAPTHSDSDGPAEPEEPQAVPGGSISPTDAAEFRQYQEFLEFLEFKQWQREHGTPTADDSATNGPPNGLAPPTTPASPARPPRTPWWKRALRVLRFKLVRRVLYVLLLLLLLPYALDYYFTGSGDDAAGGGGGGGVPAGSVPITSTNPQRAVSGVYNYLRGNQPEQACLLFNEQGEAAFAAEHQGRDCPDAARQVHERITNGGEYANPGFAENAVETAADEAAVYGCRIRTSGGPELGSFGLSKASDGGWIIASYDLNAPVCR